MFEQLNLTDYELESSVLAKGLESSEDAIKLVEGLSEDDFFYPENRIVFAAVRVVLLGSEPFTIPVVTRVARKIVVDRKMDIAIDQDLLLEYTKIIGSIQEEIENLRRLSWSRKIAQKATLLISDLSTGLSPADAYGSLMSDLSIMAPWSSDKSVISGDSLVDTYMESIYTPDPFVEDFWPWKSWNQRIEPLETGNVFSMVLPSGGGKTSILQMIAEHFVMRGEKVAFYHAEDQAKKLLRRMAVRNSGVLAGKIRRGELTTSERKKLKGSEEYAKEIAKGLSYIHAPGWSAAKIGSHSQSMIAQGYSLIIVDYLNIIPASGMEKSYMALGDHVQTIKNAVETAADRHNVDARIVTAAQQNKQGEYMGTSEFFHKSQVFINGERPVAETPSDCVWENAVVCEPGNMHPVIKWHITKQNEGQLSTFEQFFLGPRFRLMDMDDVLRLFHEKAESSQRNTLL